MNKLQEYMNPQQWEERPSESRKFQLGQEPEIIHIIPTGFHDYYLVVHEDAYESQMGEVEFHTKASIGEKFNITI